MASDSIEADVDLPDLDDIGQSPGQSDESAENQRSFAALLALNPVLQTLAIMLVVSVAGWTVPAERFLTGFVLTLPAAEPWFSPILATYAHIDTGHLAANATIFVIAGGLVSLWASRIRFHLFYLVTGVVSSVAHLHLVAMTTVGSGGAIVGASGAVLGFVGYLVTGSSPARSLLKSVGWRVAAAVLAIAAVAITLRLSGESSAIYSHFVGVALGLVAGRFDLLTPRD